MSREFSIALLTGGTGGVKLLLGLYRIVNPDKLSVIVNTADNFVWNELYVAPDIDTVVYALADLLDLDKMWGIREDTFNFLNQARVLGLRDTWFNIGDRDLAMHILRTYLMRRGYTLTQITKYVLERLRIPVNVLPMTDMHVETHILTELGDLHIQEFLIKYSASLKPLGIVIVGIEHAKATHQVIRALEESDIIVIGPSSPPVSIFPILRTEPIGNLLRKLDKPKVAVSPMIGSRPVRGITDKLLEALGYRGDVIGVAELYSEYGVTHMVVHETESEDTINNIRKLGLNVVRENIIMKSINDSVRLARKILETAKR